MTVSVHGLSQETMPEPSIQQEKAKPAAGVAVKVVVPPGATHGSETVAVPSPAAATAAARNSRVHSHSRIR